MKRKIFIIIINIILFLSFSISKDKLYIVATTQDLADFAKVIAKDKAEVISLTYGWQDPHRVELKPSMISQIRKADLVLKIGMDLDSWVDNLIFASGNKKVMYGEVGQLDCSTRVNKLEVPKGKIDASMGDIHIYGNPHYWLSPENAKTIVEDITEKLKILMPEQKNFFETNKNDYLKLLNEKIYNWTQKINKLENKKVASYHKTFVYFFDFFGLEEVTTLEPKPGIPSSPKHLSYIIDLIKKEKVAVIFHESFYPTKHTEFVSKATGVRFEVVPTSVGAKKEVNDYITLIDTLIAVVCK